MTRQHLKSAGMLGVALVATLGLGACGEPGGQAAGTPDHRQGCPEQESHDVAVGAEVGAAGVGLLRVAVGDREERHPGGGGQSAREGDVEDPASPTPSQQDERECWPQEVELLLDRQRPGVLK